MAENGGGIAAAATPVAGLIGSFLGYRSARKNTERSIEAERELAKYQYEQDKMFWDYAWNKTNEYNSPAAQMERLKAAGLNPNMVYGSGSATGATASMGQLPKYNAPSVDYRGIPPPVNLLEAIGAYQDYKLKAAQTDNIAAQTRNTELKTQLESGLRYALTETKLKRAEHDLSMKEQGDPYRNAILNSQMEASKLLTQTSAAKLRNIVQQNQNLQSANANIQADTLFKQYRNQWMRMGFTSSDNIAFRIIARMLNEGGLDDWSMLGKYTGKIFNPQR